MAVNVMLLCPNTEGRRLAWYTVMERLYGLDMDGAEGYKRDIEHRDHRRDSLQLAMHMDAG